MNNTAFHEVTEYYKREISKSHICMPSFEVRLIIYQQETKLKTNIFLILNIKLVEKLQ